jgi:SNF family Na+-dependent transporter
MRKVARGLAVLRRLATCGSSPFARVHAGRGLDFRLLMQVFKNKAPSACAGRAFFWRLVEAASTEIWREYLY